jgi:hypothetical protein
MGTRATIFIKGFGVGLYKHWDGYESNVLPMIHQAYQRISTRALGEPELFFAELCKVIMNPLETLGYRIDTTRKLKTYDVQCTYMIDLGRGNITYTTEEGETCTDSLYTFAPKLQA